MLRYKSVYSKINLYSKYNPQENYIQSSNLFLQNLNSRYSANSIHTTVFKKKIIPIIPQINLIKSRSGLRTEVSFKYLWGWKRHKQSYLFISKLVNTNKDYDLGNLFYKK